MTEQVFIKGPEKPHAAGWGLCRRSVCAAGLMALCLAGCAKEPLPSEEFRLLTPASYSNRAAALEAAKAACEEETRRRGVASIVGIFSRMRKGAASEDYIECMRLRGFDPNAPEQPGAILPGAMPPGTINPETLPPPGTTTASYPPSDYQAPPPAQYQPQGSSTTAYRLPPQQPQS